MASTRQILLRRRAAANIAKVTNTMETISAVRYRHYYKLWLEGRDFYDSLARLAYLMVTAEETLKHPLLVPNKSRTNALLVIGSDRGLCGAYNGNISRLVDVHINMSKRFNRPLEIYVQGAKAASHLAGKGIEVVKQFTDFNEVPSPDQAREIGDHFVKQYMSGKIGKLSIVYTRFFSAAGQQAQTLTTLPLIDLIDDLTTRSTVMWPWELVFEDFLLSPSADELFESIASMMVNTTISGCFLEAALSEHLGRVVAMRSATDNAEEMIEDLTREYNRARQGQITNELLDIIGGTLN